MKHLLPFSLACLILAFSGCRSNDDIPVAKDPQMIKLTAPVIINLDSTTLVLGDYLLRPNQVDSFSLHSDLTAEISPDSTTMVIRATSRDFPKLSELKIWSNGFPYSIILERTTKVHYRFTFDPGNKKYKRVLIKGQMNEWNPSAGYMFEKEGKWHIDLHLFPGKYQYKLITDGREISDPTARDSVNNGQGGYNSLLTIGNLSTTSQPMLFTKEAEKYRVVIGLQNKADTVFVLWQNHVLDGKFWKMDSAGIVIDIPRKARDFDRSYLRVWGYNSTGISNNILVPLAGGKVLTDPALLTRADHEAMILYFMMVDRFRNGKSENDMPVKDDEIDPKVNYMGGDIAGITRAVEEGYFTNLGINALWISPITQNPLTGFREYPAPHRKFSGYHGYWPITLTTVDNRFGTSDDLKQLVGEAHSKDMNVILDFVSHHVHQDYPVLKTHPDWITQIDLPGKRKNIRLWDEQRLTTWFDIFLPTFDLTKPEAASMVSDSAAFWIKEYKLDGFRHDAAKHVPENYWRMLTKKLHDQVVIPEERPVYQIGETFGSRDLIGSYINPGMLDAQFEFNLYWDAKLAFATDYFSFRDLNFSLLQSFSYYGEHNLMGNITGNQDMARFISYAGEGLKMNEDAVEAGWKRDIRVKDTVGYSRLACLQAFNMTIPGIPVIYYGDEYGMAGAGDPDNRRMMKFDSLSKQEEALKSVTSQLAKLRGSNLALIYGDFKTLKVNDKVFVYMRSYFDRSVIVVFNKDRSARTVEFDLPERFASSAFTSFNGQPVTPENGKVKLQVGGNSFDIIKNQ